MEAPGIGGLEPLMANSNHLDAKVGLHPIARKPGSAYVKRVKLKVFSLQTKGKPGRAARAEKTAENDETTHNNKTKGILC